ncbi:winged helix-turn-helix transcriptional regulator [Pseudomonas sp. CBSPBW29]|uniref:winged helix-turn-helix transcriptional regulator n=1 Tax=Pseudomonas TaxID=286 RepID=UPI0021AD48AF|nr:MULTISPECIES: winged helix-turn-helix transcriptional regulator [unclassified Pseudomonas]WEL42865.1 winged helix-turn-helix transcriptional regulator [Pseudomonas sp. CBSPBW29]WEL63935.1 winged helix-turn-helix transcriptional regulator [Pseudomonas sp. CBSPGW29]WEL73128.1 winged helix-turn-helix transcriptional regulator [Pseudomonas sp. CBSPCGW29]WEL74437.1 winged helix-turn-helix transcriptional regulator [Pseudomonas sp. CBSPAW29]WEL81327.1 winged helix-turn-helix transcriptional regul
MIDARRLSASVGGPLEGITVKSGTYRATDSADIDIHGYIPGAGTVFSQADHHQAEPLERLGHLQAADIQRTQTETLKEGRDARLGVCIVRRDERIEAFILGQYVAEEGVERLDDLRAGRGEHDDVARRNLEEQGILSKAPNPDDRRKDFYGLTEKGIDLIPILLNIVLWSAKHDSQSYVRPDSTLFEQLSQNPAQVIEEVKALLREGGCIFPAGNE